MIRRAFDGVADGRTRGLVAAVCVAVMACVVAGQRCALRGSARRALPVGSTFAVGGVSCGDYAPDPLAKVSQGPRRMLHLDAARTNRSPFKGPTDPVIEWTFDAGGPIETAPIQLANGTWVVGTLGGNLKGVSEEGQEVFSLALHERIYGSPATDGETVFVGTDAHRLVAVSAKGSILWQLETDGEADTASAVGSNGFVVFGAGATVYSVKPDGTVRWRVRTDRKVYSSPAIGEDGTVFVGSQDNRLYAIAEDGRVLWGTDLGADVDCAPAIGDDGTIYVGTDGNVVVALDRSQGKVKWRVGVGGHVRGSLTVTRDHGVVAGVYGPSPAVIALDGKTGNVRWRYSVPGTGAAEFGVHGSPVEDSAGDLYFGAQDDCVYALTWRGVFRWKVSTGADVDAPVVIDKRGRLVVSSDDGKLYCIADRNGKSARQ